MMFKKKDKIEQVPKKSFTIPKIEGKNKKKNYDNFVSPFFGEKVKDELIVPKSTIQGNINDRFDVFREERKNKEEGPNKYKEFNILTTEDVKKLLTKEEMETESDNFLHIKKHEERDRDVEITIPFGLESNVNRSEVIDEEPVQDSEFDHIEYQDYGSEPITQESDDEVLTFLFNTNDEHKEKHVEPEVIEPNISAPPLFDMFKEKQTEESDFNNDNKVTSNQYHEEKPSVRFNSHSDYIAPSLDLLKHHNDDEEESVEYLYEQEEIINNTLLNFRVGGKVVNYTNGPTVTQYEVKLEEGVMINKITNIASNLKMNLAAIDIRIEAPIPGKTTIGIEVPNKVKKLVNFGNILTRDFIENSKPLEVALGVDLSGDVISANIAKMPHGLIAGATGSGKSVCLDTMLMSLLFKATPRDLRLILIDPKRVGLAAYSKIPHLAAPIIHDAKIASQCLKWAVEEMERRYNLLFNVEARDIDSYNKKIQDRVDEGFEHLPNIVIVIEEMADLMSQAASEVEQSVMRIAQKARAAGIYLLIATQRPSVDVIKGSIKSNIPTRIALKVASNTDSMTIIDFGGAESLLGNGDMLFSFAGLPLKRLQGAYVSEEEIDAVTGYLNKYEKQYLFTTDSLAEAVEKTSRSNNFDDMFFDIAEFVIENNYASINKIQKEFNIGYNRASDIFAQLQNANIVSAPDSKNPRKVIMNMDEFDHIFRG
ncbi:DNA translocase FtsK [Mycoplasmatota bacterium WC44]